MNKRKWLVTVFVILATLTISVFSYFIFIREVEVPQNTADDLILGPVIIRSRITRFYAVSDDGEVYSTNIYAAYNNPEWLRIWSELNNVSGVTFIDFYWAQDEVALDDTDEVDIVVSVNFIFSHELAAYMEGDQGEQLMEALERTFGQYAAGTPINIIIASP